MRMMRKVDGRDVLGFRIVFRNDVMIAWEKGTLPTGTHDEDGKRTATAFFFFFFGWKEETFGMLREILEVAIRLCDCMALWTRI